jgi:hypothetical protein
MKQNSCGTREDRSFYSPGRRTRDAIKDVQAKRSSEWLSHGGRTIVIMSPAYYGTNGRPSFKNGG